MLKPLAKKAMVLSSPQTYLEEWQVHVQHNAGTLHSVLQHTVAQHGAAVRIQLRYKKYQEKVRLLLKKSEKAVDEQQQQDNAMTSATGSVKAALRERSIAGSSMALAVAYNVRKEGHNSSSNGHEDHAQRALVRNPKNKLQSYTSEMRSSLNDPAVKWNSSEWTIPEQNSKALHDVQAVQSAVNNDAECKEKEAAGGAGGIATVTTEPATFPEVVITPEQQEDKAEDEVTASRDHGFVDIMHHSWLLSSMEERCAVAAASVGATSSSGKSALHVADFRHTLLDLVFIARSGVGHNFHGHAPSSVAEHHRNLISRVQRAVEEGSNETLSTEDAQRVTRIFNSLKSDMIMPAVRCLGWILTKTWRMLFNGVHVDVESLHRVLSTIERLQQEDNVSVVFAPTHKSHLDYLIISYLCFAYGIPLPRIAAGNNLDLPLIGSFLRANGSFFIRRSFKNDQLYKHVLQSYVHELLADGNPIEVFVEGGRSRHGRVCKPRLGFLSMFHEYAKSQDAETANSTGEKKKNVVIVPIALDYDKVYEVEEYANQLLGKPKQKESIAGFLKSVWDIFFLRCGHSYVRFGAPLSLTATSSLDDTTRELAVRMQTSGTITSTAIVSALLMWKRGYQTREMLQSRVHWLVKELAARSAHLAHVADDAIADHALSILNVDVLANGVLVPQLEFPTRALEMGFYRNHVLHVFLPEMAIAGAIDSLLRESAVVSANTTAVTITLEAIEEKALMMWNFLRHICRHDDVDLTARITAFVVAQAPACHLQSDSDAVTVDLKLWKASRLVGFVLSLHWPFVDSLWLCSQGLWSLIATDDAKDDGHEEHTEREVVRRVQILARELFLQRALFHAEAFCSESIKQSLDFLVERGLIRYVSTQDGRSRAIQFCKEDDRKEEFVQALVDEVNGWRRPTTRLWTKHAVAPANLTQATAMALLTSADLTTSRSSGVYDAWMAPAVVG